MIVKISEKKIVDVWEPKEEGLVTVKQERFLTVLEVTLTKTPTADEKKEPGYHQPLTIKGDFLTKATWEQGEKEREERRTRNGDEREDRRERREGDREPRRDNREERGGERRRGRARD